jgi:hypothetical protein
MGNDRPGYNPNPYRGRPVKKGKAAKKGQNTGMCSFGRAVGALLLGLVGLWAAALTVNLIGVL